MLGQQILHKLRRTRCCAVVVVLPVAWRPLFWSLVAYCVVQTQQNLYTNTPYLPLITFRICCLTRSSELAMQNTVLIEENCEQNFCLASNLANFLRPLGKRRFPSRWLCLCFWIVAIDPWLLPAIMFHKRPASDSAHWSKAVSANKRFSICSAVSSCHAQIVGRNCMAQTCYFGHFSDR